MDTVAEEEKLRVKFGAVIVLLVSVLVPAGQLSAQGGIGSIGGGGGGFGGPSIQGRGSGGKRQSDGLRIRPYVGVQAIYDSGLTSINQGAVAGISTRGAAGVEINGGLYGTKQWKRHQLQLSYSGDYRYYNNLPLFNGSDQSLGLNYGTILTKRVSFDGSVSAGTTNRAFGGISSFSSIDGLNQPGIPFNSLFDVRMYYGSANGGITYNLSSRTSMSFSGGGYQVKRKNEALFGVSGIQARGDLVRRINRTTSVGIDYSFMTFQFSKAFGDSYVHGVGVFVARQFGRRWKVDARIGALNVETLGTRQVQIDPAIAAIIGVSTGLEVFYSNTILGSGSLVVTRSSPQQGNFSFQFSRSVIPGNGIILTSQSDLGSVAYNRRLSRKLNLDATYSYNRLRGLGLISGDFKTHMGGLGFGWQMARYTQLTARYDRRNSVTNSLTTYNLNGNRFSVGVIFTPADIPVSLW